jgi:hypothetical protein
MIVRSCLVALLIGSVLRPLGAASEQSAPLTNLPCDGSWHSIDHPSPPDQRVQLTGIWAFSSTDIWAVGYYYVGDAVAQPHILHWNGLAWMASPTPAVEGSTYLYGVSGTSSTDVWAVGESVDNTYTLHWDGVEWTEIPSPNPSEGPNTLYAVDAISPTDAWAVGQAQFHDTLTFHWDGLVWEDIPSPNTRRGGTLTGVSAVSSTDVWAVGSRDTETDTSMLAVHWNGSQWAIARDNDLFTGRESTFLGVAAIASDDVWAVGEDRNETPMIRHWTGLDWEKVWNRELEFNPIIYGIDAISIDDVWAVGGYVLSEPLRPEPITWHWNGGWWRTVRPEHVGGWVNTLTGVSAVSSNEVWAVGHYQFEEDLLTRSQIQRYCRPN